MSDLAALIILDGFALREEKHGNAIAHAHKPNFDRYWAEYPHNRLHVSGLDVGLPEGQMGNSEVGHLNIGAGRVVYQSLTRIDNAIETEDFFTNDAFLQAVAEVKKQDSALHICGLLSDGGVHSHMNHLFALLQLAKRNNLEKVFIHAFLDGRDVGPQTAIDYIQQLEEEMEKLEIGEIATVSGRYYAMDRYKRSERLKLLFDTMKHGDGTKLNKAEEVVQESYENEIYDEFIVPSVIMNEQGNTVEQIE